MTIPHHCLTCAWCVVDFGEYYSSEATPGSPADMACMRGRWKLNPNNGSKDKLAECLALGETCTEWEKE